MENDRGSTNYTVKLNDLNAGIETATVIGIVAAVAVVIVVVGIIAFVAFKSKKKRARKATPVASVERSHENRVSTTDEIQLDSVPSESASVQE